MTNDLVLPSDYPSEEAMFSDMKNEEARRAAYVLYMQEKTPLEIALEIAIPVAVIRRWIVRDRWSLRLREMRAQRTEEEQLALDAFRGTNRLEEVEAQLKAGKKGREIVMEMLENAEGLSPGMIKQLGEALKSFSDVAARAVGLGETVEQKGLPADEGKSGRVRPPAVVIVAGNGSQIQVREAAK